VTDLFLLLFFSKITAENKLVPFPRFPFSVLSRCGAYRGAIVGFLVYLVDDAVENRHCGYLG
jgi:hypothetical protein